MEATIDRDELNAQANKIEALLGQKGIAARVQGGQVTYRLIQFDLDCRDKKVTTLADDVADLLGRDTVRIYRKGGRYVIEISLLPSRLLRLDKLYRDAGMGPHIPPMTAIIGQQHDGAPIALDLAKTGHFLTTGDTGAGKTALVRAITAGLCLSMPVGEMSLILIDPKVRGLKPLSALPHAGLVADEHADIQKALLVVSTIVSRRHRTREQTPAHVVVVDELEDLDTKSRSLVWDLVDRGGRVGVHVVAGTRNARAWSGRFPMVAAGQAADGGPVGSTAHKLLGQGDFRLKTTAGEWVRFRAAWLGPAELAKVVQATGGGQ